MMKMINFKFLILISSVSIALAGPVIGEIPELQPANVIHLSLPGKQYYLGIHFKLNFFEAAEFCKYNGMQLATINSREESDQLLAYMSLMGIGQEHIWLSGTDLGHEGKFVWLSNGAPLTYTNFIPTQPDNYNKLEHCLEIRDNGKWNDLICTEKNYFACEF